MSRSPSLLDHGHDVITYVRSPESSGARALAGKGARTVPGDLADRPALAKAAAGADALFGLSVPFGSGGVEEEVAQGRALVDVAAELGLHLVYSSVRGADRIVDGNVAHADSKQRIEQYLRDRDVRATVLGPVYFMENLLNSGFTRLPDGFLTMPLSPDKKLDQVTVLDIAGMAVHAIEHPEEMAGKRVDLVSDCITGREAAQVLSEILGREIPYRPLPLEQVRQWAGDEIADMFQQFEDNTEFLDTASLHAAYPAVRWHGFADWAHTIDWERALAG